MIAQMMDVRRAGDRIGNIEARHVETADRARYEVAQMMGVHGPSVLRGHVSFYSDGSMSIQPIGADGKRLGRPYFLTPYTLEAGPKS